LAGAEECSDDESIDSYSSSETLNSSIEESNGYDGRDRKYFPMDPFDEWDVERLIPVSKKVSFSGIKAGISNRVAIAAIEAQDRTYERAKYGFHVFSDRAYIRYYRWHERTIDFCFTLAKAVVKRAGSFTKGDLVLLRWFMYGFNPFWGYELERFWSNKPWSLPVGSHFRKGRNLVLSAIRILSR